jgi:hypothetical protein
VILALEKVAWPPFLPSSLQVRLRPQASTESGESRASHVSAAGTPGGGQQPGATGETEAGGADRAGLEGEVVGGLRGGLARVRPAAIGEWNLHKHVRGDRELKPIFIPF